MQICYEFIILIYKWKGLSIVFSPDVHCKKYKKVKANKKLKITYNPSYLQLIIMMCLLYPLPKFKYM